MGRILRTSLPLRLGNFGENMSMVYVKDREANPHRSKPITRHCLEFECSPSSGQCSHNMFLREKNRKRIMVWEGQGGAERCGQSTKGDEPRGSRKRAPQRRPILGLPLPLPLVLALLIASPLFITKSEASATESIIGRGVFMRPRRVEPSFAGPRSVYMGTDSIESRKPPTTGPMYDLHSLIPIPRPSGSILCYVTAPQPLHCTFGARGSRGSNRFDVQ
jgi:hypothetical protein